jgi:hypothetical protein
MGKQEHNLLGRSAEQQNRPAFSAPPHYKEDTLVESKAAAPLHFYRERSILLSID